MEETLKIILDKLNSVDSDVKDLKRCVAVIENEHGAKLDSLMDGYKQLYEGQHEMKKDIADMKETLDVHKVKLSKVK